MTHRLTRSELHNLVWSQPMQRLAKQFGVSDVALAKACRRAEIPSAQAWLPPLPPPPRPCTGWQAGLRAHATPPCRPRLVSRNWERLMQERFE
jgi:hypothetical protein